jgi:hypothetical protein
MKAKDDVYYKNYNSFDTPQPSPPHNSHHHSCPTSLAPISMETHGKTSSSILRNVNRPQVNPKLPDEYCQIQNPPGYILRGKTSSPP